jgi:hypothetical protein
LLSGLRTEVRRADTADRALVQASIKSRIVSPLMLPPAAGDPGHDLVVVGIDGERDVDRLAIPV